MSECYLGEIRMFAGTFAPVGWVFCDGRLLSISENDALFNLIGTTYGGDGLTTFAVPDLRGRIPLHQGRNRTTGTTYVAGMSSGSENVTLLSTQLPAHTHLVNANATASESPDPANNVFGLSSVATQYYVGEGNGTMAPSAVSMVGGNQPHDNMMPFLTISFIIATAGIYPSQG